MLNLFGKIYRVKNLINFFNDNKKIIMFFVIGGINTVFGYSVFALFLWVGIHYSIAALLSTISGILFNFTTFGRFVFDNRSYSNLPKFILVYGANYFFGVGVLFICNQYNYNLYLAQAFLILPTALLRFILMKYFVYRN